MYNHRFYKTRPYIIYGITQVSSSFKRLDTRTFTYATPTFITEVLRLVTLVQLLLTTTALN